MFVLFVQKPLHPSMKLQIYHLCEMGYLYRKIRTYCDKPSTGQMTQGLKHGLQKELGEFYKFLVLMQEQVSFIPLVLDVILK